MMATDIEGTIEYGWNVETLSKLVGMTVAKWTRAWDEERKLVRDFCDIKKISGVELEIEPKKLVVLKFSDNTREYMLNLDQFSKYIGKIDKYGSIKEYLESNGLSVFN